MKFKGVGMVRWKDRVLVNFNTGTPTADGQFVIPVDSEATAIRLKLCGFEPMPEMPEPPKVPEVQIPVTGEVKADRTPEVAPAPRDEVLPPPPPEMPPPQEKPKSKRKGSKK